MFQVWTPYLLTSSVDVRCVLLSFQCVANSWDGWISPFFVAIHGEVWYGWTTKKKHTTVNGWNPANQLRLVVFPIIYRVSYIPGGCLGFQPSIVLKLHFPRDGSLFTYQWIRIFIGFLMVHVIRWAVVERITQVLQKKLQFTLLERNKQFAPEHGWLEDDFQGRFLLLVLGSRVFVMGIFKGNFRQYFPPTPSLVKGLLNLTTRCLENHPYNIRPANSWGACGIRGGATL